MKTTDKWKGRLRASWRRVLVSLLRLTYRVQDGLEVRLQRMTGV